MVRGRYGIEYRRIMVKGKKESGLTTTFALTAHFSLTIICLCFGIVNSLKLSESQSLKCLRTPLFLSEI